MPVEPDLAAYDFALPPERIAQRPAAERDAARMLILDRHGGSRRHATVRELPAQLASGDLLVVNASRVVPARVRGHKESGGRAELLLLGPLPSRPRCYRALLRCRGRQRVGLKLKLGPSTRALDAEVVEARHGEVVIALGADTSPYALGEAPLPPYIHRPEPDAEDLERYQTVYARVPGSVAAPTAGLHLSERTLDALRARGIACAEVVLHVGLGTFQAPGRREIEANSLHPEPFELDATTAVAIEQVRARGGRVVAVGTTTARVLETCAETGGRVRPASGETDLFIRPGFSFRVVDALLTNFHLPRSSLLMLVSAFAGRERTLDAYAEAIREGYRFYSYGDAMLVL